MQEVLVFFLSVATAAFELPVLLLEHALLTGALLEVATRVALAVTASLRVRKVTRLRLFAFPTTTAAAAAAMATTCSVARAAVVGVLSLATTGSVRRRVPVIARVSGRVVVVVSRRLARIDQAIGLGVFGAGDGGGGLLLGSCFLLLFGLLVLHFLDEAAVVLKDLEELLAAIVVVQVLGVVGDPEQSVARRRHLHDHLEQHLVGKQRGLVLDTVARALLLDEPLEVCFASMQNAILGAQLAELLGHALLLLRLCLVITAVVVVVVVDVVVVEVGDRVAGLLFAARGRRSVLDKIDLDFDAGVARIEESGGARTHLDVGGDRLGACEYLDVLFEEAVEYELAYDAFDVVLLVFAELAVHLEVVVALLGHLGVHGALENLGQVEQSDVVARRHLLHAAAYLTRLVGDVLDGELLGRPRAAVVARRVHLGADALVPVEYLAEVLEYLRTPTIRSVVAVPERSCDNNIKYQIVLTKAL